MDQDYLFFENCHNKLNPLSQVHEWGRLKETSSPSPAVRATEEDSGSLKKANSFDAHWKVSLKGVGFFLFTF